MRNAWKSALVRSLSRISAQRSRIESLNPQVKILKSPNPSSFSWISGCNASINPTSHRHFSSEPASDHKDRDLALVAEILSKPIGSEEIKAELGSLNPSLDDEAVNSVLRSLEGSPEIARAFFDWVSGTKGRIVRCKLYNIMLEILGGNDKPEEFWGLIEIMKKRGYRISKGAYLKVSERFKSAEREKDFIKLKDMFFVSSHENVVARMCPAVCQILREEGDAAEIEKKLEGLGICLSSELVVAVMERLSFPPKKALVFFRWVEGNPSFKIDGRVYNSVARVLGREDCKDEFWDLLKKMRNDGYEMEMETYIKVLKRFYKRRMIPAAVDLYEFAMSGLEKPSVEDFTILLNKIVVRNDLDTDLVSRVVRVFINASNSINKPIFASLLKSLRSVGRLELCKEILEAMEEGGFVANSAVHDLVVVSLCDAKRMNEACEYIDGLEKSGHNPDLKSWTSLVEKYSLAGELDGALSCFRKMVERNGGENVGRAFEVLVNGLCRKNRVEDAFKLLKGMVTKKNLVPWQSTYKFLIERLSSQGRFKEASSLLGSMKNHGYPPFIDPFVCYISKSGTADDAMGFLKATTVKDFPSRRVFICMFEALLKEGRLEVAYDLLSKSPVSVRNHVDVLNLFFSMKPDETAIAAAAAA